MDSMEASRQRAEQRHEHCAAAGHNPCKPYTFACAEAARREIEVERVPKGDVRLYGGKHLDWDISWIRPRLDSAVPRSAGSTRGSDAA